MDFNEEFLSNLKKDSFDIGAEYIELGIEQIVDSKILDEIPAVKSLLALYRIGRAFSEKRFIKNIALFLNEYQNGDLSESEINKFLKKLNKSKNRDKMLENLFILLEHTKEEEIAIVLSKVFKHIVKNNLDIMLFDFYCNSIEGLHYEDLKQLGLLYGLKQLGSKNALTSNEKQNSIFRRLENEGLAYSHVEIKTYVGTSKYDVSYTISDEGEVLGEILFNHYKLTITMPK